MSKIEKCVSFQSVHYDFTDKTGKHMSGDSLKACILTFDNGVCVGMNVEKVANGYTPPANQDGTFTYDKYRRIVGFIPVSK